MLPALATQPRTYGSGVNPVFKRTDGCYQVRSADANRSAVRAQGDRVIPSGSGRTDVRHRLNRGGNRALNAALHRVILAAYAITLSRVPK
ncbi:hypothetical protein GCM10027447_18340 [Glycomyces halotolerans]